HDPRPVLEQVSVPVLAIFGEKDLQVPHELNVPEIEAAFERGNNEAATVRVLPGLNHLFQQAESGAPSEYQQIEETFNQNALELVSSWILKQFTTPKLDTLN
ncbi:MAG: dienelactone hydrolase family protein, partial [Gemmatimonadota bacterium]|nr:dienelactone hydrolase family protein [Gemmatimonadota bacterium]